MGRGIVNIATTSVVGAPSAEAFSAGTLAGAGSFRCESCGFAISLQERDQIPACPRCEGTTFRRASIFADPAERDTGVIEEAGPPDWLADAREALAAQGHYLAYEDGERVRVVPLDDDWTRIGRSLSAHIRLDDPTVSRRHALIHSERASARILDDRSLNGVFLNGERIEWRELSDGDEVTIGRYRLYYMALLGEAPAETEEPAGTAAV